MNAARFFRRGKGRLSFRWLLPAVLSILVVLSWIRVDARIRPAAEKICTYECRSLASDVVAEGVARTMEAVAAADLTLTSAVYDENGALTSVHTNSDALNTVQTMLLENVNAALAEQEKAEFSVPWGSLTGMHTLAGRGPGIPMRFSPGGAARIALESSFASGGINQTVHRLTAVITVEAGCAIPLYSAEETVTFTYLLAETVIVGDVPAVTWSGKVLPAA